MLRGSCACGNIRYEISGDLIGPITYCHCWRCRKHSGSSFGTTAGVLASQFEIVSGREDLATWESSPGINRHFARCCGSPIYKAEQSRPEVYGFRLGTLDTDPKMAAALHFMVESRAPWVVIDDRLDQRSGGDQPFPQRY